MAYNTRDPLLHVHDMAFTSTMTICRRGMFATAVGILCLANFHFLFTTATAFRLAFRRYRCNQNNVSVGGRWKVSVYRCERVVVSTMAQQAAIAPWQYHRRAAKLKISIKRYMWRI